MVQRARKPAVPTSALDRHTACIFSQSATASSATRVVATPGEQSAPDTRKYSRKRAASSASQHGIRLNASASDSSSACCDSNQGGGCARGGGARSGSHVSMNCSHDSRGVGAAKERYSSMAPLRLHCWSRRRQPTIVPTSCVPEAESSSSGCCSRSSTALSAALTSSAEIGATDGCVHTAMPRWATRTPCASNHARTSCAGSSRDRLRAVRRPSSRR
mmetsp:Transcript_30553/g.96423  ORF Transcript_30553/g.96423 Transcript_30553/m.96423 type:complete len:217 (-) Transcript_30553:152-802(-)